MSAAAAATPSDADLFCPACGFDLRATVGERCGECGLEFDRDALRVTAIPWAHRRRIGRVRAYFKTLWQFTLDRPNLRHEASKPQDPADARSFRRVTAIIIAAGYLALFGALAWLQGGLVFLAVQPAKWSSPVTSPDDRIVDLIVPWCAGATLPPVLPLALVMLSLHVTGVQRFAFRAGGFPEEHRRRAFALGHYTTAPLIGFPPAVACALAARWITLRWEHQFPAAVNGLIIASASLALVSTLVTIVRTGQWLGRTRHCGFGGVILPVAEWFGLWLLGLVVLLGLLPWCAGFLWIAFDSLR